MGIGTGLVSWKAANHAIGFPLGFPESCWSCHVLLYKRVWIWR